MVTQTLKENGLYICLFVRSDPPVRNDFHWALYLHHGHTPSGMKYHITGSFKSGWFPEHAPNSGIMKSFLLVGLVRIADVPAGLEGYVDRTFRTYDEELNDPDISCRVWVWRVLALLQKPGPGGMSIFECEDTTALEKELFEWGNENSDEATKNVQPRPIHAATFCGLHGP
jgi:hypothetical protein